MVQKTVWIWILWSLISVSGRADVFEDYFYTVINNEVRIDGYRGTSTSLDIPSTIQNLPVKIIGWGSFLRNYYIEEVTIPNGVRIIEGNAFSLCLALKEASIPPSVIEIGQQAFLGNTNMEAIYFFGNMPSFGYFVFDNTPKLKIYRIEGSSGWTMGVELETPYLFQFQKLSISGTESYGFKYAINPGKTFSIQSSSDLVNWQVLSTGQGSGRIEGFWDTGTSAQKKFYRISEK
jgi:hypothetical protein